jgi:fucose permease
MILTGVLGMFYGILMFKSYKLGFAVYAVSFIGIILGIVFYLTSSISASVVLSSFNMFTVFSENPLFFAAVFIGGIIILSAVNWGLVRKLEIKS